MSAGEERRVDPASTAGRRREDTPLDDRDSRVLAEIARRMRAEDPDFAAALTGPLHRPQPDWTPVWLRILAFLLLAGGSADPAPAARAGRLRRLRHRPAAAIDAHAPLQDG
jgi:hypothetical protein